MPCVDSQPVRFVNPACPKLKDFGRFYLPSLGSLRSWHLVFLAPAFFSACATLAPEEKNVASTIIMEPGAMEAKSAGFRLIGRVSVKEGRDGFSGGVQWRHLQDSDQILLLSPIGQAVGQIERTADGVSLITAEQEHYYADNVEELTERVLGWRLPLSGLQYWVQGTNSPDTPSEIDLDIAGRVAAVRQNGWEITYAGYSPGVAAETPQSEAARARLLTLNRDGLRIRLVIDEWNTVDD
ncbi:lipoprotein insertase outer membrane protein LolB [Nitrosospira multiformis]|uniref:Outer-membrane lipoprotein LolB n=1 Tax=Nitrosospira multiformis TaxID=1231 RepID=A0A1I7F8M7_9PROT|nr:lipoprotein insertase outer membrane protein LolB [Nitrosospira multiformis]SFU32537.1 outer membrane lipoprotein LolB [Nitrosospira multiformis]